VVWQNELGGFLGSYDRSTNAFPSNTFAPAVGFGGANLQPPTVGLGPAGKDVAVVFAQINAAEAWRVDSVSRTQVGRPLVFPSLDGLLGQVSAVPASGALYATYADYTPGGVGTAGQRFFVKVACF
jgi:hypothetical protein